MEIVHGDLIFNRGIAEVIGLAVNESRFKSAASDECGKAIGVVVPTIGFFYFSVLAEGGSTELATPYDDGVIKKAALFEVKNQGGACLVGFLASFGEVVWKIEVVVPSGVE